VKGED